MDIPIVIICFNNYEYVENTIKQLNVLSCFNIIIMDNYSDCKNTIEYLRQSVYKVIHNKHNISPRINLSCNIEVYNSLPSKFILTDPDLELNPLLPNNFVQILSDLSDKYRVNKVGFALDISDHCDMFQGPYNAGVNIYTWESQFWTNKIVDPVYELYVADIDTTFCLVNKNFPEGPGIRIAGCFTARHMPWYINNTLLNTYQIFELYNKTTRISTISSLITPYINDNYFSVQKNKDLFLFKRDYNSNNNFWKNCYTNWESETFKIFDQFLDHTKVFIDIGGWIGTTAMYGSRYSKHVYTIEADSESINDIQANLKVNCKNNYTVINNAIYSINDIEILFGKNKFLKDSKLNDSTSQIYLGETEEINDTYLIKTISLDVLIKKYNIIHKEISLIKVDIEGGEEHILEDLLSFSKDFHVTIYISFHHAWWVNKDLDRFTLLTNSQKITILNDPFCSLLFNN